jgi:hypothetical protein
MKNILNRHKVSIYCLLYTFYSLILHPVAREIKFNYLATSRNHFSGVATPDDGLHVGRNM